MSENPLPTPIRSRADIDALEAKGDLTSAENALIAGCQAGEMVVLEDGTRPTGPSDDRTVRADLLRYLILGGCEACRVDERGVGLQGAWVAGQLDLSFATALGETRLENCVFETAILAPQARLRRLDLAGCRVPGLSADDCIVVGNVWLARIECAGSVALVGAEIGGQLDCEGAKLDGGDGTALNAEGAMITGGVFLRQLKSQGEVSLSGAEIGGQLNCEGAQLDVGDGRALNAEGAMITGGVFLRKLVSKGEVSFSGAEIGGQLSCSGAKLDGGDGKALNGQRMRVSGSFFWRDVASVAGRISLAAAYVADLGDDRASWDKVQDLILVGMTYDNLIGPLDMEMRTGWLKKGAYPNGDFHPQPYQQLAKVLRESGHRTEARKILIAKEREQRRAARRRGRAERRFRRDLRRYSIDPSEAAHAALTESVRVTADLSARLAPVFNRLHGNPVGDRRPDPQERRLALIDFRNRLLWANAKTRFRIAGATSATAFCAP